MKDHFLMNYNSYSLVALLILLFLGGCGDTQTQTKIVQEKPQQAIATPKLTPVVSQSVPKTYEFNLSNGSKAFSLLQVKEHHYHFSNIAEPIILVNFFSTWCPPCRGELPHLNNLQERYKGELFIMGLLVHDDIDPEALNSCIASQKVNYFIANNQKENQKFASFIAPKLKLSENFKLPLMIVFLNGKYYTHYLGSVPEEMIESDIKQALKNIEGSK